MDKKVHQLPLDKELDRDIIDWLEEMPRPRRNEILRAIIRRHIAESGGRPVVPVAPFTKKPEQSKKEPSNKLLGLSIRN